MNTKELHPEELKPHPLSGEIFGDLPQGEYEGLKEDIRERGIQDPLQVTEGMVIVCGHQRAKAAKELGIRVPCIVREDLQEEWQVEELLVKDNLLRRHLNDYQKLKAGVKLEEIEKAKAKERQGARTDIEEEITEKFDNFRQNFAGCDQELLEQGPEIPVAGDESGPQGGEGETKNAEGTQEETPVDNLDSEDPGKESEDRDSAPSDPQPEEKGRKRDRIASRVGFGSGWQYEKAKKVYRDAPEKVKKRWEEGDLTTHGAYLATRRIERERKLKENPPETPEGEYGIIYADPPWRYDFSVTDNRKVENKYPTMSLEDLKKLDIPAADDAVLFLWVPNPKLKEGIELLEAWGFSYKTNIVWVKDKLGMGYWVRGMHELLLVGTRGNPPRPAPESRLSSVVVKAKRGEHSTKPDELYEIIEQMLPNRKPIELFARRKRRGWDSWGNEV